MTSVKHNVLEVSIFVNGKMKKINSVQRMHAGRSSVTKTGVAHFSLQFCQLYKTDHSLCLFGNILSYTEITIYKV